MKPLSNQSKGLRRRARPVLHEPMLQLSTFLPYRLSVLASIVSEGLAKAYERFDIGVPEWRVIATVGEFGAVTSKGIAQHAHMNKVQVARAAASLEARGLIRRIPNRDDLREHHVAFTPAGARTYRAIATLAETYATQLKADITKADLAALDRVINALRQAIDRQGSVD